MLVLFKGGAHARREECFCGMLDKGLKQEQNKEFMLCLMDLKEDCEIEDDESCEWLWRVDRGGLFFFLDEVEKLRHYLIRDL